MDKKARNRWQEPPQVFGLLGNPVAHSLSPAMHRAAFQAMGLEAEYVAFQVVDLPSAIAGLRGLGLRGASVTIPFKEQVIPLLDQVDEVAVKIGAVNTILNSGGRLTGHNTDWAGFLNALSSQVEIRGESFAILGGGGAARAAAYGIMSSGGRAIILNRDPQRARKVGRELGCLCHPLERLGEVQAQVLINTTPVGMSPREGESPVSREILRKFKLVMDVVYNPVRTRLLREAQEEGALTITGVEMFVQQGADQIRLWTHMEPPLEVMRQVVLGHLEQDHGD